MKILHTSDWHLGMELSRISLLEQQRLWGEWLCETVAKEKIRVVMVCGDVFDRAVSTPDAIRLYTNILTNLHKQGAAVVMIAGNHDGAARLSTYAPLLEHSQVYIAGQLENPVKIVEIDQVRFFLLPYYAVDRVKVFYPEAMGLIDGTQQILESCRPYCTPDKQNILLAHCFAVGGQPTESDRSAVVGGSAEIPLQLFEGFDYVALGHIHRPQRLGHNIYYCGTPMKYSFSEANQVKTAPVYDTQTKQVSFLEIPEFLPLRILEGSLEELLQQGNNPVYQQCFMRLIRKDGLADLVCQNKLRDAFANVLQIEGKAISHSQESSYQVESESISALDLLRLFYYEQTKQLPEPQLEEWFLQTLLQQEEQPQ